MNQQWKEQLEKYRDNRKEEILTAAQQLFLERGLGVVKLNDIVKQCGISKVTFYKYYKSIDEVTFAVQMKLLEKYIDNDKHWMIHGKNGWEKMEYSLRYQIENLKTEKDAISFIGLFDMHYRDHYPTPELENAFLDLLKKGRSLFKNILLEGIQDGSIRNDIDITTLQFTISNITSATIQRMALRGEILKYDQGIDPDLVLEQMVNMILEYLKPVK
ncbi:TetR/AcrR family transcriptional regulator [Bacillus salipaludis]|uniref:TetR/AcrR family transcriptional regulator n=1 Tax=Bacillus salipaludis TaxID=2547811 RepID=A0AA90ZAF4_9BACI|nr:TetR/AcrR family transcriptional regulator [Bacillus salipaludis]MDQ6600985.1 TetR/AcrR family transcriptional regulator [Bacillus salipaludis]